MNQVKSPGNAQVWLGILATIASVGVLLAFQHVVREGVQRGELRRKATAMQAEAAWRCKLLRELDSCLVQQSVVPRDNTLPRGSHVAMVADR